MFNWTWTSKTLNMFKTLYYYVKEKHIIGKYFYSQDFADIIKQYINLDLDKDWLGRLYGVINPAIDINGNFNVNNMIIEIDGDNTNNNEYLKTWLYKQLNLVAQVFNMKNLYTYINMDIEHIGPLEYDNYLVIFDIVSRQAFSQAFKKWFWHTLAYGIIAVIAWIIYIKLI